MTGRHALVAALVVLAACADFDGTGPGAGLPDVEVSDPSFVTHVMPVFERRCALGGCHTVASRQGDLVLTRDSAWVALVNRAARLRPSLLRVMPGDAAASWLIAMIAEDPAPRGIISRMPLGSGPLTPNQVNTIVNWVNLGARPD